MATVKGKWDFNKTILLAPLFREDINFIFREIEYNSIRMVDTSTTKQIECTPVKSGVYTTLKLKYEFNSNYVGYYVYTFPASNIAYTFDFGENAQEVSEAFYSWLKSNATQNAIIGEDNKIYTIKGSTLRSVADAIRSKTGKTDPIIVEDFTNGIEEVYDSGQSSGRADGYEEGYSKSEENIAYLNEQLEQTLYSVDTGGKSCYDTFWDIYQENGKRTDYQNAFAGVGWNEVIFKPKYPFGTITNAYQMFRNNHIKDDLTKFNIDISNVVNADYMFYSSWFTKIGVFGVQSNRGMNTTFGSCIYLETIEQIKSVAATTFNYTFDRCYALTNITFEGVIANDISFKDSTLLTKDSITSIITHLSDAISGKTLTLSETATFNAFDYIWVDPETGEEHHTGYLTSPEWNALKESKPNWTITLV